MAGLEALQEIFPSNIYVELMAPKKGHAANEIMIKCLPRGATLDILLSNPGSG